MAIPSINGQVGSSPLVTAGPFGDDGDKPAAVAAARVSRAGLMLGALGLGCSLFVVARLFETWRLAPDATASHISILGQRLSYPTANADAIVILVLAGAGLAVTALTIVGAIRELAAARRLQRGLAERNPTSVRGALVIDDQRPLAFCTGLLRPQVFVSTGALALLDDEALDAVLAHERHHARRRDPLRLATGRVLARALFFVPGLTALMRRHQVLAELGADESAIAAAPGSRSALARAMLSFCDASAADDSVGIDPVRIDHLFGERPNWGFPALLCVAGVAVIASVVAIAVLAGQVANGSATLAPPFLSAQPCMVVLAMVPGGIALIGATSGRKTRSCSALLVRARRSSIKRH